MSKKPLDLSGKTCTKCGKELTVIRVRRWGRICLECAPEFEKERRIAELSERAKVLKGMKELNSRNGCPPPSWIQFWTTPLLAAMHHEYRYRRPRTPMCLWPFQSEFYKSIKSQWRRGDRICFFRSPEVTWQHLCGREGYAVFRGKVKIYVVTTMLN